MDRQKHGKDAEQAALSFLEKQKLKLLDQNYSCRMGEIDLIMLDRSTLVFVEVRSRQYKSWGGASASVDYTKQRKLIKTASHFLSINPRFRNVVCRFDVVAYEGCFTGNSGDSQPIWYKDAFRPDDTF